MVTNEERPRTEGDPMNADRDHSEQPVDLLAALQRSIERAKAFRRDMETVAKRLADAGTTQSAPEPSQAATEAQGELCGLDACDMIGACQARSGCEYAKSEPDTRTDRFADAIYDEAVDHAMWIGDDGKPLDYLPERATLMGDFIYEAAAAVMAVADAEQDELRAAVVELAPSDEVLVEDSYFQRADLPRILGNFMRATDEAQRDAKSWAMRVEAAEAKVARVEALCEAKEAAQRLANERYVERNIVEAKTGRVFQGVPILTCREVRAALDGDA